MAFPKTTQRIENNSGGIFLNDDWAKPTNLAFHRQPTEFGHAFFAVTMENALPQRHD